MTPLCPVPATDVTKRLWHTVPRCCGLSLLLSEALKGAEDKRKGDTQGRGFGAPQRRLASDGLGKGPKTTSVWRR